MISLNDGQEIRSSAAYTVLKGNILLLRNFFPLCTFKLLHLKFLKKILQVHLRLIKVNWSIH